MLQIYFMTSTIDNLSILASLGVKVKPMLVLIIVHVQWMLLMPCWIKISTNGEANGYSNLVSNGGMFQTTRGFVSIVLLLL